MAQLNKSIKFEITDEFVELIKLLKLTGLFSTGGQAKIAIENGDILVDGEVEFRKRRKIRKGMTVRHGESTISAV